MFFFRTDPNDPRRVENRGEAPATLDRRTPPTPARDGYARLSQADRQTGRRPMAEGEREFFPRRVLVD